MKIEMGIGWKPDPETPGGLVSCTPKDYVAEIEHLRRALQWYADASPADFANDNGFNASAALAR